VNALANEKVGEFFNKHFISAYQKVGTFKLVNGQKQGGNVAGYFCLGDGTVLHAIAGPVDADTLLREAKWVHETRKLAMLEGTGDMKKYHHAFRKAHAERLQTEHGIRIDVRAIQASTKARTDPFNQQAMLVKRAGGGNNSAKVHALLVDNPAPKLELIYKHVFESILGEKISTQPVARIGG